MGKSKKKSTVGYKYYVTLHFAVCHGTVDALRSIWWADKVFWSGNLAGPTDGTTVSQYAENNGLFGGENSEGGAEGLFEFGPGTYLQEMTGVKADGTFDVAALKNLYRSRGIYNRDDAMGMTPTMAVNYRGLAVVMLHNNYIGNNAYLKDISFEVERYWKGWQPSLSRVGDNMNPAHIIYECLTNSDWGLGYPASTIDQNAFLAAAQTLYNEGFGLSFVWDSDQDIEAFIEQVKVCIDASFYLNRRTGLWTLKLIRAGGTPKMVIDTSNATLDSFSRKAMGETFNELSVSWTNPVTEEYETVVIQDPASIEAQGRVLQTTKEYVGVRTQALAIQIAQRDLQVASAQLATVEVVCNREAWALMPGDIVTFNWRPYGLNNMTMRVIETEQAEPGTDSIRLQLAEDVFARASGSFSGIQEPGWVDPSSPPVLFTRVLPWEFPFWYVARNTGIDASSLPAYASYGTALASGGSEDAKFVRLYSLSTTESGMSWLLQDAGAVTPTALLSTALTKAVTSQMTVDPATAFRLSSAQTSSFILLSGSGKEEIAQITAIDDTTGVITVDRALMDTQPQTWPVGTTVYFIGTDTFATDSTQRSAGEVAQYKPAMQTSIGQMPVDSVPAASIALRGRYELPYPVANVTIAGSYWPSSVNASAFVLRVDWSTRNRLLLDAPEQVRWGAGNVVPEEGTTFGVELYSGSNLATAVTGITGTGVDVPVDMLTSGTYRLVVYAVRDGRRNYIDYEHTLNLTVPALPNGYGNSYGMRYGV